MIEANRDEALRCASIALRALEEGDVAKAEKFAQKGQKLFNCSEVAVIMARVQSVRARADHAAQQPAAANGKVQDRAAADERTDTSEQRKLVAGILKAKDLYEILGLPRTCNDDDIKKAYRKLALKLHPDKNSAAHAEEAFKAVSKAFSCLSDGDKRACYDRTSGQEQRQAAPAAAAAAAAPKPRDQQQQAAPSGAAGSEPQGWSAEAVFDQFFRDKQPRQAMQDLFKRARTRREQEEQKQREAKVLRRRSIKRKQNARYKAKHSKGPGDPAGAGLQGPGDQQGPGCKDPDPGEEQQEEQPPSAAAAGAAAGGEADTPAQSEAAARRKYNTDRNRAWRQRKRLSSQQGEGEGGAEEGSEGGPAEQRREAARKAAAARTRAWRLKQKQATEQRLRGGCEEAKQAVQLEEAERRRRGVENNRAWRERCKMQEEEQDPEEIEEAAARRRQKDAERMRAWRLKRKQAEE